MLDKGDQTRFPHVPGPSPPIGGGLESPLDTEEVVRLGDGHVSGVESLCVGESQ
jgi:hypothetical protein